MQRYFEGILKIANELPNTKFLVYTKRNDINFAGVVPDNLVIRFSYWPGFENKTDLLHFAWIKGDTRIPRNSFLCPKDCRKCSYCWNPRGKNVIFEKH